MILAGLLLVSALDVRAAPSQPGCRDCNVVMVVLDALRADHLGCYGYRRPTSPAIDRLAREGVRFKQAIAQASWTWPSVASLLTSRYPLELSILRTPRRLAPDETTLVELLRRKGYRTAAFAGNPLFRSSSGFARGFEIHTENEEERGEARSFRVLMPQALSWIERHRKERFFVYLHSLDVHAPYDAPPPFDTRFDTGDGGLAGRLRLDSRFAYAYSHEWRNALGSKPAASYLRLIEAIRGDPREAAHIIARYDGGIAFADHFLQELWESLERWKLNAHTIVVLLADHGEDLGEKGRLGHQYSLNEPVIRVPLVFRLPHAMSAGSKIDRQVELIDVAPTLLDLLGILPPAAFSGRSFAKLLRHPHAPMRRFAFSASEKFKASGRSPLLLSVRSPEWKLILDEETGSYRLYDPRRDPGELHDEASARPPVVDGLLAALRSWQRRCAVASSRSRPLMPDESLRRLGYVR